jgi:cathepsin L
MNKTQVGILTLLVSVGVILLASQNFTQTETTSDQWSQWKLSEGVKFSEDLEQYRKLVFYRNYDTIERHNSHESNTFKMGLNQFSHLSVEEFDHMMSSKKGRKIEEEQLGSKVEVVSGPSNDVDWEKAGKVSPVKSQGQCDAGYAFCSNSLGESFSLMNKTSIDLSEQQIVDCSADYTTFGCSSGSRSGTLKYLQEKGVTTETKYPWLGTKQTCKTNSSDFKLTQNLVTANGCNEFKTQLEVSPLTVAVNTTNWQFYRSGVLENCGNEVNHDIFLVGFSEAAWRLKNSWGVRWGEYGYIRIRMGDTCGICSKPGFGYKL